MFPAHLGVRRLQTCDTADRRSALRLRHGGRLGNIRANPFPTYDAEEDIRRALDAGASGYLLKDSSQDDLIMPRSRTGGILANCSGDNASTSATLVNV